MLLGMAVLFGRYLFSTQAQEPPEDRFLRAVYVLQKLGGPAAAEVVDIPRRIRVHDDTESLLHHPDKVFVRHLLASELESLQAEGIGEAALFEAYVRADLGENTRARNLLIAYVAEHPYQPRHYILLCSLLEKRKEYGTLRIICAEWRAKDARCLPERVTFSWLALCHLGRFAEARDEVLRTGECLDWKRFVYAARAAHALGDEAEAALYIEKAEGSADYAPSVAEALYQRLAFMDFEGR
jgi:hypothetical protein